MLNKNETTAMKRMYVHKHAQHISSGCGEGIFSFLEGEHELNTQLQSQTTT
jgi:hypothetical protein